MIKKFRSQTGEFFYQKYELPHQIYRQNLLAFYPPKSLEHDGGHGTFGYRQHRKPDAADLF
ncbi:MAG: hypothetical protein A2821_03920 [Candidatus Magasanikbacteria bacterium RIFCSPHIGHO2_01_FULL_41_23]|uniref:Uncharacterized protein n=1 Tax=Candidatus Magasanikbacteria bacterium RIFCSPLOWO2_01_FULL_40_15 TaxID=1798686 RepID=A0A1F6N2L9_9BACT|nr:MAG: hypothetical protein A2821_03920 [Candidatus Magasanikbacteria bacterium RIFCSPHIGHO2_01_FULL_41_23]OGH66963.1 MAG: hypothetical protein A3C66_00460 [Candidatus Magasanikbacteria bacterium RIFCSPHIGHO2_02_FULL_41_35]OGH74944.1 MAG: hypothetical protein A3F22_02595 [Candidatus Magasanikbacteria bacterium RIFCSPHIGHO2_12_FULL_41_16]OGH78246.1 MAG: hypothetical protein A2983_02230 [Candidatus Magasanikbacteria bacterium RIFCSPLOWO2_01_FULL_40_15]